MNIAMISAPVEDTPPERYGGTERVVSYVTEELIRQNHNVSLFATSNSMTCGTLYPLFQKELYKKNGRMNNLSIIKELWLMNDIIGKSHYDIIHCNHFIPAMMLEVKHCPALFTMHNDIIGNEDRKQTEKYRAMNLIAVSNNQAERMRKWNLNVVETVYNGIDANRYVFSEEKEDYLTFLGSISPHKGADIAVWTAIKLQMPLKLAGKIGYENQDYFKEQIEPFLKKGFIEYVGEVNDTEKNSLLRKSKAFLFPIQWEEPFGLVMLEALSCGTPVIAFDRGSVSEIIENGKTGYIVKNKEEMAECVKLSDRINRKYCRKYVKNRFSIESQAKAYLTVYHRLIKEYIEKGKE